MSGATTIERGNLALTYEPGQAYMILKQELNPDGAHDSNVRRVALSFDDIAWLIHTAGPAALAAGTTITPKENE